MPKVPIHSGTHSWTLTFNARVLPPSGGELEGGRAFIIVRDAGLTLSDENDAFWTMTYDF
jgi:hypothetical protein